jgi:hypothetical protein
VLFALEEAASFWSHKVTWRCFLSASVAVFTLATLNQSHDFTSTGMVNLQGLKAPTRVDWAYQLPFFFCTAAFAGPRRSPPALHFAVGVCLASSAVNIEAMSSLCANEHVSFLPTRGMGRVWRRRSHKQPG